jgi:hypothetical protein
VATLLTVIFLYFAGYDGYPNFFDRLMNCILEVIDSHPYTAHKPDMSDTKFCLPLTKPTVKSKNSDIMSPGSGDHGDSGIDTGDSSDEKKKRDFPVGSLSVSRRSSATTSDCRSPHETSEVR